MTKMSVPIPVLLSAPTRDTPGDAIRWKRDQKAWLKQQSGRAPVTIVSGEFVGHDAVPGVLCIEVAFDEENGTLGCVNSLD